MIQTGLLIAQLASAVLLGVCVLLQPRGTGLGGAFGGEGNVYRTRRGVEKRLQQATIILSIIFFGASLTQAVLS